jgi:phosphoglycolate phosphatase-like HAD superfamily hydrolase
MMGIMSEDEWRVTGNESDESIARCDETYQLRERVGQLERLNAILATQVDRLGKVADAAIKWADTEYDTLDEKQAAGVLLASVNTYQEQMAQLAKESE